MDKRAKSQKWEKDWPRNQKWPTARTGKWPENGGKIENEPESQFFAFPDHLFPISNRGSFSIFRPICSAFSAFGPFSIPCQEVRSKKNHDRNLVRECPALRTYGLEDSTRPGLRASRIGASTFTMLSETLQAQRIGTPLIVHRSPPGQRLWAQNPTHSNAQGGGAAPAKHTNQL